jgi:thiamine transport system ATP-binding protein
MIRVSNGVYRHDTFELAMNFDVARGNLVAVIGPSGAGKSTLLNILAGFETLLSGTIELEGREVSLPDPAQRPVSMVFQDNNTFAHLDCWQNVAIGMSSKLRLSEVEHVRVDLALQRVGLKTLAHRKPGELSGGERQRIALARVLVRDKPVLLLDEPFAALGPSLRCDMLDLVAELHKEKQLTTLMVTHAPDDAKRIADQVMFVADKKVRDVVPVEQFFALRNDIAVRDYLG